MANKIQLFAFGSASYSPITFNPQALVKILTELRDDEILELSIDADERHHGDWLLRASVRGGPRDHQVIGATKVT